MVITKVQKQEHIKTLCDTRKSKQADYGENYSAFLVLYANHIFLRCSLDTRIQYSFVCYNVLSVCVCERLTILQNSQGNTVSSAHSFSHTLSHSLSELILCFFFPFLPF